MPITSVLIGCVLAGMTASFRMEQGVKFKQIWLSSAGLAILFSFLVYGFFIGIRGLCPYLGRY